MTAPEPAFRPTIFYNVAGTDFPLPPDARLDLAYLWTQTFDPVSYYVGFQYVVDGNYYEIPVHISGRLTASAQAGTRGVAIDVNDSSQVTIAVVPAFASQGSNVARLYEFQLGAGTSYGPVGLTIYTGIPPLLLHPQYELDFLTASGGQTNDAWDDLQLTTIRIPNGPAPTRPASAVPSLQLT